MDFATDYSDLAAREPGIGPGLRVSRLLESAAIRHCLIGDIVARVFGSDVFVGHTIIAVADDQLAAAGALLSASSLLRKAAPAYYDYFRDYFAAADRGPLPGFVWAAAHVDVDDNNPCRIMVMPATFWHLDLGTDNDNTVLARGTRFPNKLYYVHALIQTIARLTRDLERSSILTYLGAQLCNATACFEKEQLAQLPAEDGLFLELFYKVLLPSARVRLCEEYDAIQRGTTTVDEAVARIPRRGLDFAKWKQARKRDE